MVKKQKTNKKKEEKKNSNENQSKKTRRIFYVVGIVILSILLYLFSTFVTTKILDAVTKRNESSSVHDIFDSLDKIDKMTIDTFIENLNKCLKEEGLSYQVKNDRKAKNNAYLYTVDEEQNIRFYIEPIRKLQDKKKEVLSMSALFIRVENDNDEKVKQLLSALLKANNSDLSDEKIIELINDMNNQEDTTEKDGVITSSFYQEEGLEVSKRITEEEVSYRVGRIME